MAVTVNGEVYHVELTQEGASAAQVAPAAPPAPPAAGAEPVDRAPVHNGNRITAPMPGKILEVLVKVGDSISYGDEICILEAMKMQQSIRAPRAGVVKGIGCAPGQSVAYGHLLIELG
ncbi:MAG: acetyl-CoA carboxylase biotin carboxyl carrier protein subunit [Chloroflexi bacterium]|nr:acetyl-CoA carboxylase biotin carboxyl carrier protein subunit [Chloroflexota bacterium]